MTQLRLNGLMTLHIHQSYTDTISLENGSNTLVEGNRLRESIFGRIGFIFYAYVVISDSFVIHYIN